MDDWFGGLLSLSLMVPDRSTAAKHQTNSAVNGNKGNLDELQVLLNHRMSTCGGDGKILRSNLNPFAGQTSSNHNTAAATSAGVALVAGYVVGWAIYRCCIRKWLSCDVPVTF